MTSCTTCKVDDDDPSVLDNVNSSLFHGLNGVCAVITLRSLFFYEQRRTSRGLMPGAGKSLTATTRIGTRHQRPATGASCMTHSGRAPRATAACRRCRNA